jgi:hypothetical protein
VTYTHLQYHGKFFALDLEHPITKVYENQERFEINATYFLNNDDDVNSLEENENTTKISTDSSMEDSPEQHIESVYLCLVTRTQDQAIL